MESFAKKTAFVTGGGSGIGLALGRALLEVGAQVMLADINEADLASAVEALGSVGPKVDGVVCDVSDHDAVLAAAERTYATFGDVHVLVNNAGVSRAGFTEEIAESDWQWVIGTNIMGVVHGVQAFLPRMKARGGEGHIVNTASISGLVGDALSGPYATTKSGVIGLSEVLLAELAGTAIGVSVLCPGAVRTRMPENGRNRPARFGGPFDLAGDAANAARNARYIAANEGGLDPSEVAAMVLDAIRTNRLYVLTHSDRRADVDARHRRVCEAFDATASWEQHEHARFAGEVAR
jgi:NAD(P)-dependent dehydrogenase (short-subunit alcohol dehydrogenase family)